MPDIKLLREKRLAEIDEREKAATKGPWRARLCEYQCNCGFANTFIGMDCTRAPATCKDAVCLEGAYVPETKTVEYNGEFCDMNDADADFCANARQDVPWMSARIKELEAENEEFKTKYREIRTFALDIARRLWDELYGKACRSVRKDDSTLSRLMDIRNLFDETEKGNKQLDRIAALEKTARTCGTCTGYKNTGEEPECVECRAWPIGLRKGWTFDEKRYMPRGEGND